MIALQFKKVFTLIASLGLTSAATGTSPAPMELTLEPARAEIGIFHSGVELVVSADVEPGVEVALLVTGPPSVLNMRKKERVWGLFWAPTQDVTFEKVPSLYFLQTFKELEELAPKAILNELGLGYEALRPPHNEERGENLFQELIRLKESEGLFLCSAEGATGDGPPRRSATGTAMRAAFPANAPATTYSVELFGFKNGKLVARGEASFELRQSNMVAFISSLAREHGLLYGLLAVMVALAAGLGVGFLYGSAGKK